MSTFRFQALNKATDRKPVHVEELDRKSVIFGSNVFGDKAMRQFLTPDAYKAVKAIDALDNTVENLTPELIKSGNNHKQYYYESSS